MIRLNICIALLLFWITQGFAATDAYVSAGTTEARYSETIDGQNADLQGTEQSLTIRKTNYVGNVDLGLDAGTLKLTGTSPEHQADFEGNYINLTSGLSFTLYPSWIEYYIDIGYRIGLGKLRIQRSQYKYTFNAQMSGLEGSDSTKEGIRCPSQICNWLSYGVVMKSGIKFISSAGYLLGVNYENKGKLMDQNSLSLNPRIHSSSSVTVSLGYRFGGS